METYIGGERYPSLLKVKDYIRHFEDVENAKKNLQKKMKIAFGNVRGKKRRGPGIQIDLESLYVEASDMSFITATSRDTLSVYVVSSTCAYNIKQSLFYYKVQ